MNNESVNVSVAMATYNGARFIQHQLDSLARQTLLPTELVVTDDGSSDSTLEIVERFATTAPFPVRLFRNNPRLGYAENFLHAVSLCDSPLIAFCDQDDEWVAHRLETIVPFFSNPEVMLVTHTASLWDGEQLTGEFFPQFERTTIHAPVSLDPFSLFPGFSIVFRAEILKYISSSMRPRHMLNLGSHEDPEPMAHDNWVTFLAAGIGATVTIAESLIRYRQHGNNTKGAPKTASSSTQLMWTLEMKGYAEQAEHEALCATVMEELSKSVSSPFKRNVLATRDNFNTRSRYHMVRSVIYDPESNVFRRVASFVELVSSGAYGSDTTRTRLGGRAALKDMLFGLPALARLRKA
jgi:hypothetical protein